MGTTAAEQYMLEMVNRARLDPRGEAQRLSDATGSSISGTLSAGGGGSSSLPSHALDPLAGNSQLDRATDNHVGWMLQMDRFSHTGEDGSSAGVRMGAVGYNSNSWAENIAFRSLSESASTQSNVDVLHRNLFESDGHRVNLLDPNMREIGISIGAGDFHGMDATFAAQNFGRSGSERFLTGVVYNDRDGDDFYSIGEGRSGVTFSTGGSRVTSENAGGYSLTMGGGGRGGSVTVVSGNNEMNVQIHDKSGNVKLDLINGDTLASSSSLTMKSGAINATLLGSDKLSLIGNLDKNTLTGNNANNVLNGRGGGDKVFGEGGNDKIIGGKGQDYLSGGDGRDTLFGGEHSDTLYGDTYHDYLKGGSGNDKLYGGQGHDKLHGGSGQDELRGGTGYDRLFGGSQSDKLYGEDGQDYLRGAADSDKLYGGDSSDKLFGEAGQDLLRGGNGNDWLFGGYDADLIFGDDGADVLRGGNGSDKLSGGLQNDRLFGDSGTDNLRGGHGNDELFGGDHDDQLFGELGQDLLNGGRGHDEIFGGDNSDRLFGESGQDNLNGGHGSDTLFGGKGNDTLDGGFGNDTLTGGAQADTFIFRLNGGHDTITDFDTNADTLALDTTLWAGDLTTLEVVDNYATVTEDGILFTFETDAILIDDLSDLYALSDQISFI